jgi:hypothetical protein
MRRKAPKRPERKRPLSRAGLLRERLGFTQGQIERATGGSLRREEVSKLDYGDVKGTSWRVRDGLARAFGVDIHIVAAYLDGELDLDGIVKEVRGGQASAEVA